ncbi:MAG TPA: DNA-binding protein [Methanomassiliicoccales archaeon]|nr:DNA-binding protein [Methanomassiliicoccales archaeon]HQQ25252.1 DNA-binding protein [Methanomassiliicoccales archaeon]
MKCSVGSAGRVLVIRLEDGDVLHECVERAAKENGIARGAVLALGGADQGSRMVVGPRDGRSERIEPMLAQLAGESELAAVGTIFPDENGEPSLHMHASAGRDGRSVTGCVRAGVKVWLMQEVVVIEILGTASRRVKDPRTGFHLLEP